MVEEFNPCGSLPENQEGIVSDQEALIEILRHCITKKKSRLSEGGCMDSQSK